MTEPGRLLPDPRGETAALLEVDAGELGEDDDLFELGLDSLTVIRLASGWRRRAAVVVSVVGGRTTAEIAVLRRRPA